MENVIVKISGLFHFTHFFAFQDSGAVEFLKLSQEEESVQMRSLCQVTEHLDAVVCVKVTCQRKSALTGSLDLR